MGFTLAEQTINFLLSCLIGFALGVVYELFRVIRLVFRSKTIAIFFQDVFYFIFCGVCTFLFLQLRSYGEVRFYILFGEILGWILYYMSIGTFVFHTLSWLLQKIRSVINWINQHIVLYTVVKIGNVKSVFSGISAKFKNKIKKTIKPEKIA